ncbi:MFS transporter [Ornithinibacillus halotolerans]|uniref:MFS transporter n=1 Tax=Ornithinibacillus halotolerans TaxID=1274357 RepID=A0A916RX58_9BACI|nr:MFS transporter [Ornithinibacillus halotolerans]GGA71169.1 MFS transporter [Ornithinibacillus halotolerans]
MNFRKFLIAQSILIAAGSVVFPFYLLLIKNVGDSYSQFGWAYGLFTLTAAFSYPIIGRLGDRFGDKKMLLIYTLGMAAVMLLIPLLYEVWQVYVIQIVMGILGAVQKNTEKAFLARNKDTDNAATRMGNYHLYISLWSGIAIILTGYLIDFLTIASLFYFISFVYIIASFVIVKREKI